MAVFALILALLALGTAALTRLRRVEIRRPLPPEVDPMAPLSPGDLRRLRSWQRRLRRALVALALAYLFLVATALFGLEPPPRRAALALALLGVSCLLAVSIQFSERCPRCGFNLGFQSRLVLPASCSRCGGSYR